MMILLMLLTCLLFPTVGDVVVIVVAVILVSADNVVLVDFLAMSLLLLTFLKYRLMLML